MAACEPGWPMESPAACILLLLLLGEATAFPSARRPGHRQPTPACPPEDELLPCVCHLRGTEIHITCENSEKEVVVSSMETLMKRVLRVEELHLVSNRIPVLPGRIFGSIQINKLFLINNEMVGITRNAFAGLESSLQHLYISEPGLYDLPFDTLDNLANLRTCVLENTDILEIPRLYSLSKLEFLKIDGSKVSSIPSAAFRFMPNMKKVHIANSQLKKVEGNALEGLVYLKEVNFSNNAIDWIHPRAFRTLNTVEHLSLAGNQLSDAAMAVLAARELRELRIFDLSRNLIAGLAKGTFFDMPTVQIIYLRQNLISKVERGAFFKLPALRRIDLRGNLLDEFHADIFMESLGMEHLNIAQNNLTYMTEMRNIVRALPNLKSLDMSKNHLKIENPKVFEGHLKLEALKIDHNEIEQLQKGLFQELPNLRELYLSNNFIQSDFDGRVWDLPMLRVLDLSHNEMKKVDIHLLEGLPQLSSLDLSFNVITDVAENTFVDSTYLKSLNMSFNSISKLPKNIFAGLGELFELELSFNELLSLDDGLFLGLTSLEFLHLTHNQIVSIDTDTFNDTSKLRYLDLSANLVQDLPAEALGKLSSLHFLKLHRNAINQVLDGYLKGLRMVEHLDLSNNHIQVLSQTAFRDMVVLRDLDLSVNYIQNLHPDMFSTTKLLEKLNISHNYITDLGHHTFSNVKHLRILDLTNNSLTELGEAVMGLSSLQGLFISDNYISILKNTSFIDLPNLDILKFDNNGLQTFEVGTFHNLNSLITLDMRNNNLVELNPDSFKSLTSLEELQLSKNQIAIIKDFAFTDLTSLRSLELQDNAITEMGAHAFHNMPTIKFINLSRNGFQDIPEDALGRLVTLDVLDLSWNYILEVKDSSFYGLERLTVLMLHDNDLCRLSGGSFTSQRALRVLTLHNNQLRRLHLRALGATITGLSLLDMSGNPFQCDCDLVWLRDYLTEDPDDDRGPRTAILGDSLRGVPVCSAPPQYKGLPITKVPAQAFLCEGETTPEDAEVCVPRFLDPLLFTGGETGGTLDAGAANTLFRLTNQTKGTSQGGIGPSYLDYNNPIMVHELPAYISPATTGTTTRTPSPSPATTTSVSVQAPAAVPLSTTAKAEQQLGTVSSSIHTVTGDTPTIYAGSSGSSSSAALVDDHKHETTTETGLFSGLVFPTLPNILDTITNFRLPNIGFNVNWAGLPIIGRHETGSVSKFGPLDEDKPMKGPDNSQPIWIDGPTSPHPLFPSPPPPIRQSMAMKPPPPPAIVENQAMGGSIPRLPVRGPGVPFVFPVGKGERLRPGVPGVVVPVSRPTNVWGDMPHPGPSQSSLHPHTRPALPSVMHPGPEHNFDTPFLPVSANQQSHTGLKQPNIINRQPSAASHFTPTVPQRSGGFLPQFPDTGTLGGKVTGDTKGTVPRWSPPAVIHPDSGVSHYQPNEPFLPYQPHDPKHPITIVDPPNMSGAHRWTPNSPNQSIRPLGHVPPMVTVTPTSTETDMSPSESQVGDTELVHGSQKVTAAGERPPLSSPDMAATASRPLAIPSSFSPTSLVVNSPIINTQLTNFRPYQNNQQDETLNDHPMLLHSPPSHAPPPSHASPYAPPPSHTSPYPPPPSHTSPYPPPPSLASPYAPPPSHTSPYAPPPSHASPYAPPPSHSSPYPPPPSHASPYAPPPSHSSPYPPPPSHASPYAHPPSHASPPLNVTPKSSPTSPPLLQTTSDFQLVTSQTMHTSTTSLEEHPTTPARPPPSVPARPQPSVPARSPPVAPARHPPVAPARTPSSEPAHPPPANSTRPESATPTHHVSAMPTHPLLVTPSSPPLATPTSVPPATPTPAVATHPPPATLTHPAPATPTPDESDHSLSDLLGLLYAAEDEVQREQHQETPDGDNLSQGGFPALEDTPPDAHLSNAHLSSTSHSSPSAVTIRSPVVSSTPTPAPHSTTTTTTATITTTTATSTTTIATSTTNTATSTTTTATTNTASSTTTSRPAAVSSTSSHTPSNKHNLSDDIFPPPLGEGVTVLKDLAPDVLGKSNSYSSGESLGSLSASSSEFSTVRAPTNSNKHSTTPQQDGDYLLRHPMQERPELGATFPTTHSRSRPGVVFPVDKSGEPLLGSVPRVPTNNTYISPSKSMGRGGYPTIERVYQPGQVETDTVEDDDLPPETQTLMANATSQEPPHQETEFGTSEVNAIDWYYNNYYREYASLPVGGNKPTNGAHIPALELPVLFTCLLATLHLIHW